MLVVQTDVAKFCMDGNAELWKSVNPLVGDAKTSKVYFLSCKVEHGSPPMLHQVIVVEDGVLYYALLSIKVSKNSIESAIVTISR